MADEVDLGVPDLQRLVHLDDGVLLLAVGALGVRHLGLVGARSAAVGAGALVGAGELLDVEAERLQVVVGEEVAGLEVVVLGERVGEAVALDDDLVALGLEELAPGERDQHDDQREMERQVAELAQVALLSGDGVPGHVGAEAALLQQREGGLADLLGAAEVRQVVCAGSRVSRRGAPGGRPRSWPTNCQVRGTMQPMREMNSRM